MGREPAVENSRKSRERSSFAIPTPSSWTQTSSARSRRRDGLELYIHSRDKDAWAAFKLAQACEPKNPLIVNALRRLEADMVPDEEHPPEKAAPQERSWEAEGRALFQKLRCSYCHSIEGAGGATGPKLDDVGVRLSISRVKAHIKNPAKDLPKARMPRLRLSDAELNSLASYLVAVSTRLAAHRADAPR
ncbi:MAG: cytochrome c [Elusimicrobia bacterium]|nr:cytochrome c [Elusimicrobiota bacterium]